MWDAGQYLRFGGERARPFFDLVAQDRRDRARLRRRPRLRPGQPHGRRSRSAGRTRGDRRGQLAGDDRRRRVGGAADGRPALRCSATCGTGGQRGRRTCSSATRCCSGCPATTTCCCAGPTCSRPAAGSLSSCRATSTSRATRSSGSWPGSPRWRALLAGAKLNRQAGDPAEYVELLARPGFEVDAWETSYLHILRDGENPVLEWTKGSALRPVLAALDAEQARGVPHRVRGTGAADAYHPHPFGTLFPFRRVFTVVHRRADPQLPANQTIPIELLGEFVP